MRRALFGLLFLYINLIIAQDGKFNFGARSAGISGASVTIDDVYSLFNNIGGLAGVDDHTVFAGYQNKFNVSSFQVVGAGGIFHSELGNAGIGFYRFGDGLFSQQRIHIAISSKIQLVSLGLGADLIQHRVSTIGTKQVLAIQFGGIAEINPQLLFGAHIFNLNQAKLLEETGERVPTVMKAGISYRPHNELMLNVELEKDLDFDEVFKAGVEYRIIENIFLRTGISTNPLSNAFGFGFYTKLLHLDYSFSNDRRLGAIHEVSISYAVIK